MATPEVAPITTTPITSVAQAKTQAFPPFVNTTTETKANTTQTTQNLGPFEPMPVFENNIPTDKYELNFTTDQLETIR